MKKSIKEKKPVKKVSKKAKLVEEPKVEEPQICYRCGGKKHEPNDLCDAMQG